VPVFWEQKIVRGKFRTAVSRGVEATSPAFNAHFDDMVQRYGKQYIVNLLGKKDNEKNIAEAFEQVSSKDPQP
jgi:hypothetical protein